MTTATLEQADVDNTNEAGGAQMHDAIAIKTFVLGGNATFPLRSKKTGVRFTYRVRSNPTGDVHFVSVLTSPDSYSYAGIIRRATLSTYTTTAKSFATREAPSQRAITWFLNLLHENVVSNEIEFFHCGRCCVCGRELTDPESIARGIGPVCVGKL